MKQMDDKLSRVEKKIEKILKQLNELLEVEAFNRKHISEIEPQLNELKRYLTQNSYQYNRAEIRFEVEIDDIKEQLNDYYELTEEGNYSQGSQIVEEVTNKFVSLKEEIEIFPELYKKCKNELPLQLDELLKGISEMKSEGYVVEHLNLTPEINDYQTRLIDLVLELEKEGSEKVKTALPEMEERIKEMYELLERSGS